MLCKSPHEDEHLTCSGVLAPTSAVNKKMNRERRRANTSEGSAISTVTLNFARKVVSEREIIN